MMQGLPKLMLNIAKSHPSMSDINPPELLSYELSDYTIDVSRGDVSLDITARIKDDLSGVFDGTYSNGIGGSPSQARWVSPSGKQYLDAGVFSSPVQGDYLDGVYVDSTVVNSFSEIGKWKLDSVFPCGRSR